MLQRLDLFGKAVILNFNGGTRSRTRAGGLFSLAFLAFIAWSVYHVGEDIIYRRNPKTVTSQYFSQDPKEMILTPETFTFAFGVQRPDTFAHYIDDSIYTIEVVQKQLKREVFPNGTTTMTWTDTKLRTERCTQGHFGQLGSNFADMELDQLFCFTRQQSEVENIRIQGVFESPVYEYLAIGIKECNENTSLVPCASVEKRRTLLEQGWFAVYFTNLAFDTRNYTDPSIHYRDSIFTTFGQNYFKEATMWLNHIEIASDGGWLTQEVEQTNYIQFDKAQELFTLNSDIETFFRLIVRVGKVTTRYERSYIKVQDVLADVNGLAGAGILVAVILVGPYANIKFYESLINELFEIKTLKKDKKDKKEKQVNRKKKTFFMRRKNSTIIEDSQTDKEVQMEAIKINMSSRRASFDFSTCSKQVANKDNYREQTTRDKISKTEEPYTIDLDKKSSPSVRHKPNLTIKITDFEQKKDCWNSSRTNLGLTPRISCDDLFLEKRSSKNSPNKTPKLESKSSLYENLGSSTVTPNPKENSSKVNVYGQLQRSKPSIVKPHSKVLEVYEQNEQDAVDVILENLVLDSQDHHEARGETIIKPKSLGEFKRSHEKLEKKEIGAAEKKLDRMRSSGKNEGDLRPKIKHLRSRIINDNVKINMTFCEYLQSFIWRSEAIKEKIDILIEGRRRIDERLDIFNVFKKLREVDKLKLLLLENEQLVLFDCLPKPQLLRKASNGNSKNLSTPKSHQLLREAKFINEKRRNDLMMASYEVLRKKSETTMIDNKLLNIYDEIIEASP